MTLCYDDLRLRRPPLRQPLSLTVHSETAASHPLADPLCQVVASAPLSGLSRVLTRARWPLIEVARTWRSRRLHWCLLITWMHQPFVVGTTLESVFEQLAAKYP